MPFLNKIYTTYKDQGLEMIAMSIEGDPKLVQSFVKKLDMKYPTFVAEDDLLAAYEVQYIPFHIFIDKQGSEKYREAGFSEEGAQEFEDRVKELLKE